jgi:hypothetical protein
VRFDTFAMATVEVWHGGSKVLDAKPLAIGEFTGTKTTSRKNTTEIGYSRLLKALEEDNEKRQKDTVGILTFGGGENDV